MDSAKSQPAHEGECQTTAQPLDVAQKDTVEHIQDADPSQSSEKNSDAPGIGYPGLDAEQAQALRKRILRKMDIRLIPVLTLLYLLSFLDRSNIGNANIQGLSEDLGMTPDQFNWCLTAFFFSYCAFEVPSNVLLKRLKPSRWLPFIMACWGIVMIGMAFATNFAGLITARIFLGLFEAGLAPGISYYLTMWYCSEEIQVRQALFFAGASSAGAFGGLLAYAIGLMDGTRGLHGWQWLFLLEGVATVVIAVLAVFLIYDFPDTASFLTEEERAFVTWRLKYQSSTRSAPEPGSDGEEGTQQALVAEADEFQWKYIKQAFSDWQIYLSLLTYWGIVCPLYGISFFLPTILRDLGYTANKAQLMTIPIYVSAAIIAVIFAYLSDKMGRRSPFIIGLMVTIAVGYVMAIGSSNSRVVYAGVFLVASAVYSALPGHVTWLASNLSGSYKRATGMAIQIGIGNLSGAMASNFYRARDSPRFYLGHGLELGFVTVGLLAAVGMLVSYRTINGQRRRRVSAGEHQSLTARELSEMGDKAPTYRYLY